MNLKLSRHPQNMKRRALATNNNQQTESNSALRDTIPDYGKSVFAAEERDTRRTQVDALLDQTAVWYRDIVIKKKLPPETVAFRIKLFNLIKNDFLKAAFEEIEKIGKTNKKKLATKYQQNTLAYIGILRNSQYEQLIGAALADRLTAIFNDGDWHSAEGLGAMLLQLRPLLTSSFEND